MTTLLIFFYAAVTALSSFHCTTPPARNLPFYVSMQNTSIRKESFVVTSQRDRAGEGVGGEFTKTVYKTALPTERDDMRVK